MAPQHLYPESAKSQDWRDQKWPRLRSMYHKAVRGALGVPQDLPGIPGGSPGTPSGPSGVHVTTLIFRD